MGSASAGVGVRAAGLLAAVIFWWVTGQAAIAASFIDYLYVEASEGDSSGGHVAVRFGNETFHFQHESPGILRVQRHESAAFHHTYAMLGNRSIREIRIAVSEDTYTLLRDAFVRLLLVQGAQLEIRDALHRDVALIALLLRQQRDPQGKRNDILLPLSGLGYFLPDARSHPKSAPGTIAEENGGSAPLSPALVSLRNRILATCGESFIARTIAQERARLRGVALQATRKPVPPITPDAFPTFGSPISTRYEDTLLALFALELLQAAPLLREGSFWTTDVDTFKLEPYEALHLKKFAAQLETDLVNLVGSRRSDWGLPFVVGMARLAAIEATLASGRLVLLDIFPRDGQLPSRHDSALRPYMPKMKEEMREIFLRKRTRFFSADAFREADYAAMERSGNLLLDMHRAMATGSALRAIPETPYPSRQANLSVPPPGEPEEAILVRELAAAQAAESDYSVLLEGLYAYNLVRRNCVTEIFAVINRAFARDSRGHEGGGDSPAADPDAAVWAESEKRLGGFVDAAHGLAFIPFVSAGLVESSYAVVDSRDRLSYRAARLAEMKARETPLKVFLRESNTITSSVYRPGPGDSAFLFFTDDALLLRPLFGAFNLIVGVGEGLLGVLAMPIEGPGRLLSGTKGVLFSLPELLFVNLRKGSMAYVEKSAENYPQDDGIPVGRPCVVRNHTRELKTPPRTPAVAFPWPDSSLRRCYQL